MWRVRHLDEAGSVVHFCALFLGISGTGEEKLRDSYAFIVYFIDLFYSHPLSSLFLSPLYALPSLHPRKFSWVCAHAKSLIFAPTGK